MASSILSIGQSALAAAQAGLATTGHNVANAATPGYSRQVVEQAAAAGQDRGYGFIGRGTDVVEVRRIYSEFIANQVTSAQTAKARLEGYHSQIGQIDSLLADPDTGISPALHDLFRSMQNVSADPASAAARQSLISSAQSLAARFAALDGRLSEIGDGVNSEITASITTINAYAGQIAQLNDAIGRAQASANGRAANDLLDQRNLLICDLSREIRANVVQQGDSYNVFIGNGQPLVIGNQNFSLVPLPSATDASRVEVGYAAHGKTIPIADAMISGGRLGGLLEFRTAALDTARNAVGRVAMVLGSTVNAQHRLGQKPNGDMGGDVFTVARPQVSASMANTGDAIVSAELYDAGSLAASDYRLRFNGNEYSLTRLSDGEVRTFTSFPQEMDGITLDLSGTAAAGDSYLIRPTAAGASSFSAVIAGKDDIAAAAPIATAARSANTGSGRISAGSVNAGFDAASFSGVTLEYDAGTGILSGFPGSEVVVIKDGIRTTYADGTGVEYEPGATIAFAGIEFTLSGTLGGGDQFTISRNSGGTGDSRNMVLLAKLQEANTVDGKTTSYQGAYAQLVSMVGNKARELAVASASADRQYTQAVQAQQSVSGVNLDEEAANLVRYQQAYQAAAKVMQTASQLFDTLLQLGS